VVTTANNSEAVSLIVDPPFLDALAVLEDCEALDKAKVKRVDVKINVGFKWVF